MKYLFINTATTNLVVAILIEGKIIYLYNNNDGNDTSSKIMPILDEAFSKSKITINDIDKIFVVNGPGSFTGIRVGLTIVKTIGYCLNIPVVPISSLEVMASGFDTDCMCLIDARRGYVYAGSYDKDLNCLSGDCYVLLNSLDMKNLKLISFDSFDFEVCKPLIDVVKIINKHKDDEGVNPHMLNPKYLKLTEAEEKRLNDQGN
ncbi:MAG: tRNA (adenosine(37)-N6)-threonylcarbamoyltransferase complex dimerization subunit type 1 TsaB [Bacilli bacterium]|nr:tRNA (adenosine(37)-N6)-threonylcarbamoyltransferase complex dimerization subunit type 1 TsaB [Bacilli bacterium]